MSQVWAAPADAMLSPKKKGAHSMDSLFRFEALNARLEAMPESPMMQSNRSPAEKRASWLLWTCVLVAVPLLSFLPTPLSIYMGMTILSLELVCIAILLYYFFRYDLPQMRYAGRSWARLLDDDFPHFTDIVQWVRTFPRKEVARKKRYLEHRNMLFITKQTRMVGPTEKLGLLPVLVALWLQFKDISIAWPPHINWAHINWISYGLSVALITLFIVTRILANTHFRSLACLAVLEEALRTRDGWPETPVPIPDEPAACLPC
jgi:low affinity Fe/Cu permease